MKKLLLILFAILPLVGLRANDWTFQSLTDEGGEFYLYNPYTGMFLGRGNDFATRASVNYQGLCWKIEKSGETYTLHNSETEKAGYLFMIESTHRTQQNWVFVDNGTSTDERIFWKIEAVDGEENTYYLKSYSDRYIRPSDDATYISSNSANTDRPDRFYWKLITKNERQSRKTATISKPQDMTWRIFNQNMDHWPGEFTNLGKWQETHTGALNLRVGHGINPCTEVFNGTFDISQTHSNFPKGTYTLKAQGFYRVGDGVNDPSMAAEARRKGNEVINAYFYAEADGKVTKKNFCSIFDNNCTENKGDAYVSSNGYEINGTTYYVPTTKESASKWFSDGAYEVELTFDLPQNGSITIGAKNETDNDQQWSVFDNFRLYYQPYFGELNAAINEARDYESTNSCTIDGLADLLSTIEANHDNLTQDEVDSYTEIIKGLTPTKLGTDIYTAWWNVFSDYYTLEPNDAKHISFTHHCADAGWPYRTFGTLFVTNAERGANGYNEYVATRMDNNIGTKNVGDANWGTLNDNSINGTSAPNDGNTFLNFMNGANVDMYIYRNGADIYVKTIMSKGETEYCKYYKTTGLPEGEDVKLFLSGEGAYVDNFIVLNTTKPTILGEEDNSTDYLADITDPHFINDNEAYTYEFKNHNSLSNSNWQNYILKLVDSNNKEIVLRADHWDDKAWNSSNFTFWGFNGNDEEFKSALHDADVKLTIYNKDGILGVNGTVSKNGNILYKYAYTNSVAGRVYSILSVSRSWLELTNEGAATMPAAAISDKSDEYAYGNIFQTVSLTRTLKAGWNTICLPFATTAEAVAGEGAVAYAFTDVSEENELTFSKVANMEANVPYLFYCENEAVNPNFNNVTLMAAEPKTITPDGSAWSFKGNYTPGMDMNGKYGVTGDKVRLAGSGSTLNGMRAYLEGPDNAQATVKVNKFDTEETGIILTPAAQEETNSEQIIYDLSGRRVNKTQKGIYIINGKKVMK